MKTSLIIVSAGLLLVTVAYTSDMYTLYKAKYECEKHYNVTCRIGAIPKVQDMRPIDVLNSLLK